MFFVCNLCFLIGSILQQKSIKVKKRPINNHSKAIKFYNFQSKNNGKTAPVNSTIRKVSNFGMNFYDM